LLADRREANPRDIEILLENELEKQIERPIEDVQFDLKRRTGGGRHGVGIEGYGKAAPFSR
jgi:hypothetical protein